MGAKPRRDEDRRSESQKKPVLSRLSTSTHAKLRKLAKRERRSMGAQAALYIERGIAAESAGVGT